MKNKIKKITKTKYEVINVKKAEKELKQKIEEHLSNLEEMIDSNKGKEEINKERKKLDKLLEEYLKDL